jgi:hypothetical protein
MLWHTISCHATPCLPACRSTFTGEELISSNLTDYTVEDFLADATSGATEDFL